MTIEEAVKVLNERKWQGVTDWQINGTFIESYELVRGQLDARTVYLEAIQGESAIAIATGLLAQERIRALEAELEHQHKFSNFCEVRTHSVEADLAACQQEHGELQAIFDLQWTRMGEATKYWQDKTGQSDTHPDLGEMLHWFVSRTDALERELAACQQERNGLRDVIRDIDAHATPIGLADENDSEGNPRYYAVTVGALHRALGKSGTAPKCLTAEIEAALGDFETEMRDKVIPEIVAAVKERAILADDARRRGPLAAAFAEEGEKQ